MKNLILYIVGVLMLFALQNCGKPSNGFVLNKVSKDMKDWMFFDTGSWWVYQEQHTGEIDSQYVTKSEVLLSGIYKIGRKYPDEQDEFINIDMSSGFRVSLLKRFDARKFTLLDSSSLQTYLLFQPIRAGETKLSQTIKITEVDPAFTLNNLTDTLVTILNARDDTEQNDSVEYRIFKA